ncbi:MULTISPECIES: transposase [unclassified Streptomyces]|uniref:transposase n=1 Tax=unclassified Streptomyces TaxID=2593676 RepID=UPI003FA34E9B
MDKRSGRSTRTGSCLPPSSLDDLRPQNDLARCVTHNGRRGAGPGPVPADCTEKRDYPPNEPGLMLRLLIYGHATGVCSARVIERNCAADLAFRSLTADQATDFRGYAAEVVPATATWAGRRRRSPTR